MTSRSEPRHRLPHWHGPAPYRPAWRWLVAGLTGLGLAAACLAALAAPAAAQVQQSRAYCDEPDKAVAALKAQFGEVPAAIGLDANNRLISLYLDPDDQSWTILIAVPGQHPVSCVVSGGAHWDWAGPPVPGQPS